MPPKRITDFFKSGTERDPQPSTSSNTEEPMQESSCPSSPITKKRKTFEPKFQESWKNAYSWLKYEPGNGMLCELCLKSNKKNPFTTGCSNYRTSTLTRHLESHDHVQATRDRVHQSEFSRAESAAHKKVASKEKSLIVAMRTAFYIAKNNIAIRNYTSLLQLQEENGLDLTDLHVGSNASYASRATAEEFIELFSEMIEFDINKKLKNSEFLSLMCDESTDISVQKKLVVYGRVVNEDLSSETIFLGNLKLSDISVTADVLYSALKEFIEAKGIELSKLIGFGSDGASIMTGSKSGVATRFKQQSPHLISVHCMAHRLNLCSAKAADDVPYLKDTFQKVLTDLYYYFSKSSSRTEELKEIQKVLDSPVIKMKEVHEIRWMSFYNSLSSVYHSWKALVKYFKQHQKDSARTTFLYNKLSDYAFVATLYLMMDIIPPLAAMNMVFQKVDLDISAVRPVIEGFFSATKLARSGKSYYQLLFKTDHFKVVEEKGTVCGVRLSNDLSRTIRDAQKEFEKSRDSFLSKLEEQIDRRFPRNSTSVATAFQILGLRTLSFLSSDELHQHGQKDLDVLINHFGYEIKSSVSPIMSKPLIDPEKTKAEWSLLKPLVLSQKYPRDHTQTLWKIIAQNHESEFTNLIKLAKISFHIPLQTADCERGFSCQNHIHTTFRNRLDPVRVNQLMLIQIEGGKSFDFEAAVTLWKRKKERRLFQKC